MNTDDYIDGDTIIYNSFCKNVVQCRYFREWDFYFDNGGYSNGSAGGVCRSCTKLGESYDIEKYPNDCIFLTQIQEIEVACKKQIMWGKLKND